MDGDFTKAEEVIMAVLVYIKTILFIILIVLTCINMAQIVKQVRIQKHLSPAFWFYVLMIVHDFLGLYSSFFFVKLELENKLVFVYLPAYFIICIGML